MTGSPSSRLPTDNCQQARPIVKMTPGLWPAL